ncbi:hypothetical protein [Actinacidiphila sp. ITFR-21]|uniref:hypothetical protein n=1 Tax=Actinacidiphila sp. ITFR-21 TaxID=3075199 RepID=UPI0028894C1E|nr:hypothetical protein [Streptomyces sp. ITFR-21]WNI17586.1 hypothetical protein RLT57_20060 [Streptomyces sp. ITFR-21]WNI17726.1 hypothetical protein RLT57_20775 [Streptomyces sp. ITFR-21]
MSTAADRLWDELEKLGFEKEERPDGYLPGLPRDITELTDQDLMVLYGTFVSWTAYAAMRLVEARANEKAAKQNLNHSIATASLNASMEKTVAGRKAAAAADSQVQADEEKHVAALSLCEALDMVHANSEARAQFCSRDLSRRQNSRDTESRASRWGV